MDPSVLAAGAVALLQPYLAGFVGEGAHVLEKTGRATADALEQVAHELWSKLHPRLATSPALDEAVHDAATREDQLAGSALTWQLQKLLEGDPSFAAAVSAILERVPADASGSMAIHGNRNIQVGGSVSGSRLDTGDSTPD